MHKNSLVTIERLEYEKRDKAMETLAKNNPEMFVDLVLKQEDKKFNDRNKNRSLIRQIILFFIIAILAALYILKH
ncbi:hypothetical protein [Helicobacter cetorum]|uniref:Uncharacterized protein n=1 Tax=Helicobacter cetorum (strain ATCC BAA-540 / CCUG 52418 / MIT 99-5656) TaxID=1163745 RepID=I0EQL2_HELCM|nr:hypothetical protein [Helicobacter cetorum]AFI05231.1 hypothetical protein HCD_00995 [Helicobacter cetorum MIT 99-5656]